MAWRGSARVLGASATVASRDSVGGSVERSLSVTGSPRKAGVGGARAMGDPELAGRARDRARVLAPPERQGHTVREGPAAGPYGAGV